MAKTLLKGAGIIFKELNAYENADLAKKLGIAEAPTLLVPNGDGYISYNNPSDIKKYIESIK